MSCESKWGEDSVNDDYYYYELFPKAGVAPLTLEEVVRRTQQAFSTCRIDSKEVEEVNARRVKALKKYGAPANLIDQYENTRVTRCWINDADDDSVYLTFDIWDQQGLIVSPCPNHTTDPTIGLAEKLASVLDYEFEIRECD